MKPILLLALLLAIAPVAAQESRTLNPIARPAARAPLPAGAVRVSPPRPPSREAIEAAVAQIAQAWTDKRLDAVLDERFQRREELRDALQTKVPRDARLRVIAIQGWQVLDQYLQAGERVTEVSITLRTQVENEAPAGGFQARDGTNEFVVTLRERHP